MKTKIHKFDGWSNVLTGLGVANKDKRMSSAPLPQKFSEKELEDLYRADDIAQKVVNRIPKEMFRSGYQITTRNNEENGNKIKDYLTKLKADMYYRKALQLARLHGGSAVIMGIDDGQESYLPVNMNNIREIRWLSVLSRWRLQPNTIQWDLTKPGYGYPETYSIQSLHSASAQDNTIVHASRLIRFDGVELPEYAFAQNNYWHDSYLTALYNPLLNFNAAHDGAASTIQDFIQTVYQLDNLSDLLASGQEELVKQRLQLIDITRSLIRAIVLDKSEQFTRNSVTVTGMPELVTKIEQRLVAASNMPHTIILGEGSQGQTSGSSEKMDFYDTVAQEQVDVLMPKQMDLIALILAAKNGVKDRIENVHIEYNSLWEPTDKEKADTYKVKADADAIYIDRGVIDPLEVTKSRFGKPNSEIQVDIESHEASEDNEIEGAQDLEENMPLENNGVKTDADGYSIQQIFMSKQKFESIVSAASWISANNYSNANPIETEKAFEFKQREIEDFIPETFIIEEIGEGIKALVGKLIGKQNEKQTLMITNMIRASL